MYNSENPEFNQELRLGLKVGLKKSHSLPQKNMIQIFQIMFFVGLLFQFPSMCERIKFQMFDW